MMCINNTVCDVLSSHHQPLREAVAAFSEARKGSEAFGANSELWCLAFGAWLGLHRAHEAQL